MKLYDCPGVKEHKEEHVDLLEMLNEQIKMFENDDALNSGELLNFFTGWFGGHAFGFDKEMCRHFKLVRKYMEPFEIK